MINTGNAELAVSSRPYVPTGIDECYARLAAAIVKAAIQDYEAVLIGLYSDPAETKKKMLEHEKLDLESFFYSDRFDILCSLDAETVVQKTRQHALQKAMDRIEKRADKRIKEIRNEGKDPEDKVKRYRKKQKKQKIQERQHAQQKKSTAKGQSKSAASITKGE